MSHDGWIGVDLDGTLATHSSGNACAGIIGSLIEPMAVLVRQWLKEGRTVKIFTARVHPRHDPDGEARMLVSRWTVEQFGTLLEVTHLKDGDMIELWDDRAVRVERNTGRQVSTSEIEVADARVLWKSISAGQRRALMRDTCHECGEFGICVC